MTRSVYLNITLAVASKNASTGLPASPMRVSDTPNSVAKTTTGNTSPSAACWIRLDGNRCSAISQASRFTVASVVCAPRSSGNAAPGRSTFAITMPMTRAIVVTISKYSRALPPMRPTAFRSPVWAMPTMIVETSSGTIRPLISWMNAFERKRKKS